MASRVLIVGAGIAGLSTASYLQRNGFQTEIFELHTVPGGLCTGWKRGGYTFDGCIHWLLGSNPSSNLNQVWQELGAGDLGFVEFDVFTVAKLSNGDTFTIYTNPDRLQEEMLRLSPQDARPIGQLIKLIKAVARIDIPAAMDKMPLGKKMAMGMAMPGLVTKFAGYWKGLSMADYLARFKGPHLVEAFKVFYGTGIGTFPAMTLGMMLGFMAKGSSGFPLGGSLAFARALEAKYLSLGGVINYAHKVDRIVVQDGKAVGLESRGKVYPADYVISAADGFDTTRRLLGGAYSNPQLDHAFAHYRRYPSLLYLSLGIRADLRHLPHAQVFGLEEPVILEDGALKVDRMNLRLFHFDPGLAPAGCTSATMMLETTNDAWWTALKEKKDGSYERAKEDTIKALVGALAKKVPHILPGLEVTDLATPVSFIRYTNNWHGSYEGWLPGMDFSPTASMQRTLDGLENFWMTGQWLSPGGGLPPCGMDARKLAKTLCKKEGRRFRPD